jgi:hypothetical protein
MAAPLRAAESATMECPYFRRMGGYDCPPRVSQKPLCRKQTVSEFQRFKYDSVPAQAEKLKMDLSSALQDPWAEAAWEELTSR